MQNRIHLSGYNFQPDTPVAEVCHRYDMRLCHSGYLPLLLFREACGDANMAIAHTVNPLGMRTKQFPMRRGVAELVIADVVVNHLVENGVFYHLFGQIDTGIYMQHEVCIAACAVWLQHALKRNPPQVTFGVAQPHRQQRQRTIEIEMVVLVETRVDIGNSRNQFVMCYGLRIFSAKVLFFEEIGKNIANYELGIRGLWIADLREWRKKRNFAAVFYDANGIPMRKHIYIPTI